MLNNIMLKDFGMFQCFILTWNHGLSLPRSSRREACHRWSVETCSSNSVQLQVHPAHNKSQRQHTFLASYGHTVQCIVLATKPHVTWKQSSTDELTSSVALTQLQNAHDNHANNWPCYLPTTEMAGAHI